jgi:uncharacterized damage-inducible protein DinB
MHDFMTNWKRSREKTVALIEKIPERALDFRPKPGYRSIHEQMLHIFSAEIAVLAGIESGVFPWRETDGALAGLPLVEIASRATAADAAMEALLAARDEAWLDTVVPPIPRRDWFEELFEHEIHHRAALMLTMRLAGLEVVRMYG